MKKLTENTPLLEYGKTCRRCAYRWLPRVSKPQRCPNCRSKYWATKRTNRQGMRAEDWMEGLERSDTPPAPTPTAADYAEGGSPFSTDRQDA